MWRVQQGKRGFVLFGRVLEKQSLREWMAWTDWQTRTLRRFYFCKTKS